MKYEVYKRTCEEKKTLGQKIYNKNDEKSDKNVIGFYNTISRLDGIAKLAESFVVQSADRKRKTGFKRQDFVT